jgi:5-methylcytosine-specific restriction protein B
LVALSILALRGLNERIVNAPDLGKGKQIGHSYLMNLDNVDDVLDAWKYEILPLIEEYYFGQFDRIREELFDGSGDRLFHWEQEEIADFTADELRRTLAGLEEISLAEPETEASEDTQYTIELLLNEGVIEAGTQLVFDESKVPDDADRPYDSSERFWRCEITGKTGQSDNIKWLHNDEEYSFSGLAQTILEQICDHSGPVTGPDYWQHPEFEDQLLADLRIDAQSGQLVVDEQTTD